MSWSGGVDLVALTAGAESPNIIVHVAEMVHTPVGSAPSGMILLQPDPSQAPQVMGFISTDPSVAEYFGPNIFKGTPFEHAPALAAEIEITSSNHSVVAKITVGDVVIESELSNLATLEKHSREPSDFTPFSQDVLERVAETASIKINGEPLEITVPPVGISGGAAAVNSPAGIYAR